MNCLEFRRLKLSQPTGLTVAANEHLMTCQGCAEFARRAGEFEVELAAALAVPVPEHLADRVLLNHGLKRDYRATLAGIAAAILLAIGGTFFAGYIFYAPDPVLLTQSIHHVLGEPAALAAQQSVTQGDMAAALAGSGAKLVADLGPAVSYLHDCPVPGGMGKHIVVQTPKGKVTVLTMPNRSVRRKGTLEAQGLVAAVMPAGKGSFAIIGESRSALADAELTLQHHIRWRG